MLQEPLKGRSHELILTFDRLTISTPITHVVGTMLIGYARTSTTEQVAGIEAQERDLLANGCERIFREQTSSVGTRTQFELAMSFMREGDVLVVTKLDRLARSVADLCVIVAQLEKKGIALRILGLGMDTSTPSGKLMLNLLGSIAQFERCLLYTSRCV